MTKKETDFSFDKAIGKVTVVRSFDASLQKVWDAWTKSEILDQWWAPKPYKAVTASMDFSEGGQWRYSMQGPEGDKNYCRVDYTAIENGKSVKSITMFCDEQGNENKDFPRMYWLQEFDGDDNSTTVTVTITFDKPSDMEMFLGLGFQEGFTAGLGNLDEYFEGNK